VAKKHKEETMAKYTNAEIAGDLSLWNEYFNTSALMTDEEFYAMSFAERLGMLVAAFGEDEDEADENEEEHHEDHKKVLDTTSSQQVSTRLTQHKHKGETP
jgi:hypothetical protein